VLPAAGDAPAGGDHPSRSAGKVLAPLRGTPRFTGLLGEPAKTVTNMANLGHLKSQKA